MKKFSVAAVAASLALALAACSSGAPAAPASTAGGSAAAAPAGELKKVTVGALPIAPTAVIHLGMEKGIFADNGLEIQLETGQGGAALLPAVGSHAILVKEDGPIASPKDLAGKTVAINTLRSMGDLLTMEAVEKDGGDPSAVKFVELPFPNMQAALEAGQVDAVWTPEPFMSIIDQGGAKILTRVGKDTITGHPTMMYFTSGNLIKSDPELVATMKKAINEAMDYAQANPDEVRQAAVDKLNVNPELAKTMILEDFGGPVRTDEVKAMGDLMTKFKFVDNPADVDGLLAGANG